MEIMLKAYFNLNLGDDLFIKMICERFPNYNFHIFIREGLEIPFRKFPNLKIHKYTNRDYLFQIFMNKFIDKKFILPKLKKIIDNCDHSIYIGGSLFMETRNWEIPLTTLKTEIDLSDKYSVIGCNFGPFTSKEFFEEHLELFRKLNHISFRDQYSYDLFKELDNIVLAPDIVFGLKTEETREAINRNEIVISVINLDNREILKEFKESYVNSISEMSKILMSKGFRVTLASFCKNEGDEETVNELIKMLRDEENDNLLSSYFYRGDMDEVLDIFANSYGVIATRFHAMILGWVFNKPTLPIMYSNKMKTVIEDTDFQGLHYTIPELNDLDLEKVADYFEKGHVHNIDEYRKKAEKHFTFLENEE